MTTAAGAGVLNVLRSLDGSRVCVYGQWDDEATLRAADAAPGVPELHDRARRSPATTPDHASTPSSTRRPQPRRHQRHLPDVHRRDLHQRDHDEPGQAGPPARARHRQQREQSLHTPGYRSANFHKSTDGERAVNYSLWDTAEHCIDAISRMADMDENLEETVEIAEPDFRFYALAHASSS
jgi:heme-degrading monooxygenase HmoA